MGFPTSAFTIASFPLTRPSAPVAYPVATTASESIPPTPPSHPMFCITAAHPVSYVYPDRMAGTSTPTWKWIALPADDWCDGGDGGSGAPGTPTCPSVDDQAGC